MINKIGFHPNNTLILYISYSDYKSIYKPELIYISPLLGEVMYLNGFIVKVNKKT